MGSNGGVASTLFVDGMLEGLWRLEDGHVTTQLFRDAHAPGARGARRRGRPHRSAGHHHRWTRPEGRHRPASTRHHGGRQSGPAWCASEQGGDGGDPGGRGAQHLGTEPDGVRARRSKAASSSSARPPSGPTTTTIDAASRAPAATANGSVGVLVQHDGQVGVAEQRRPPRPCAASGATVGNHDAPGLLGGLARGGRPLGVRLGRPGRRATPRRTATRPTARSSRRRSRSASRPPARRGRPWAAPARP